METGGSSDTSGLLGALSHRYRRIVLYHLREHETATLDGLVDLVAGWAEAGPGPDESVDHDGVRAELHHVYLPALDSVSLVEYDPRAGVIDSVDYSVAVEEILDAAFEADTTAARLDVRRVLAAAEGLPEPCSPGGATGDPDDGGPSESSDDGTEEGDDG